MNGLHVFTLAGIPVHVSIWFVVVAGFFGFRAGDPRAGMMWVACLFVSVLVHELGHGLVSRRFGLRPRILLHGWGGLCAHDRAESDRDDVLIIAAGPGAGLAFGALLFGVERLLAATSPVLGADPVLHQFFAYMLYINIAWSLVNLAPLWPLDGGHLFRIALLKVTSSAARAERIVHGVGAALGIGGALVGYFALSSPFVALLAGLLAYENLSRFGKSAASGPVRPKRTFAKGLLAEAEQALVAGDRREAIRLCHQLRSDASASSAQLDRVWEILCEANVELGDFDEADGYFSRAPASARVAAAWLARALEQPSPAAARALLDSACAARLAPKDRARVETLAAR